MAREANVFVRDPDFADQLRERARADDRRRRAARAARSTGRCGRALVQGARLDSPTASSASAWACWATAATSGSAVRAASPACGCRCTAATTDRAAGRSRRFAKLTARPLAALAQESPRRDAVRLASPPHPMRHHASSAAAARLRPRRRLARDRHAAAVPVGVQGPRASSRSLALVAAKVANVGVPLLLKEIVDSLDARDGGARRAARAARRLRPAAPVDDGVHRAARVPVRQGDAARGAHDRARGLPPPARAVAALPPRAADRRPHARRRARPARHLDADQLHAVLDPADAGRDRARRGDPGRALRLDVHRDHADGARALHRRDDPHHRLAHAASAAR